MTIRITRKTARLLRALLGAREFSFPVPSADLMRHARTSSGTFYPLITRLERDGWVEGKWETVPEGEIRPPRRFYSLTPHGFAMARQAIEEDTERPAIWHRIKKGFKK